MLANDSSSVSNPSGTGISSGVVCCVGCAGLGSVDEEAPPRCLLGVDFCFGVTPGVLPETWFQPGGKPAEVDDSIVLFV